MIKKMKTNKQKILNLLAKQELNSSDISKKLGIQIDSVCVYLNELLKMNKVERITEKKPYLYKAITPLRYLKELYELMTSKMEFEKTPDTQDIELIKIVKEMI